MLWFTGVFLSGTLTKEYTIERHLETLERMAGKLAPHIDRCIFSFVERYKRLEVSMPELVLLSGQDMNALAQGLGSAAGKYGIFLQICGINGDFTHYGIHSSRCMMQDILGSAEAVQKGIRKTEGQIPLRRALSYGYGGRAVIWCGLR